MLNVLVKRLPTSEISVSVKCTRKRLFSDSGFNSSEHFDNLLHEERIQNCLNKLKNAQNFIKPDNLKRAAVLIPLCCINGEICLLYTLRTRSLTRHSGQICFPGGMQDEHETAEEAAVRETEEELGIKPELINVWGSGTLMGTRDIAITPVVGFINDLNLENLEINKHEVHHAFVIPLLHFCNKHNCKHTQFKNSYSIPVYFVKGYRIWGITGHLTHTFLKCLLPDLYKYNVKYVKPIHK